MILGYVTFINKRGGERSQCHDSASDEGERSFNLEIPI